MFDRAPQDNELRRVMDACLPGLENRPDFDRDVLRQVRGEVKVKKKLSVGFVLVIVLVLAAVTALAAALLWEQQVVPMKEIEQAEGDYVNWSISQKQALIPILTTHMLHSNKLQKGKALKSEMPKYINQKTSIENVITGKERMISFH